jgi:putative transposase
MKVLRAYKTELSLNNEQRTACYQHAGAARYAFNWGLNLKKQAMDKREKIPNAIELHRKLNQLKKTDLGWMYQSSKCSPQEALRNLDRAFDNFFRRCKAKKKGQHKGKVGFPKFKSKKKGVGSFRLTGTIKVFNDRIQLPKLETLRLKERGYIPTEGIKILSATVSEHAGRWFVSVQCEQEVADPQPKPKDIVGIDLGIKTLAFCSDGKKFENPKVLRTRLKKLKRLSRAVSRKVKGSMNRKKAARRVAKLHYKISNIRKDTIHKMTTWLTKNKSAVGIEDLNVAGMLKNRKLAQAISEIGFGEFRRQLDYKGKLYGCNIVVVDRFFPSSKMCHVCGCLNESLTLSDRTWECPCGEVHDRDYNASMNLRQVAVSSTETLNAYGEDSPLAAA